MNALALPRFAVPLPPPALTGWDRPVQAARVASASSPDSQTFAAFVRQYEAVLQAKALHLCGNPTDARDLVQDTFERALLKLDRFREGTNAQAWLFTLLHHLFIDRCRSRTRERRADVSVEDVQERVAAPVEEDAPAWAAIGTEQLRTALARIPEEFRVVYQLHAIEGRSYIEIAERLGIPKATVGTRLIRARRKLRELLMPTQQEAEA
jgi:RNA polymerase sigma-70 factor (ECF subfamily)